MDDIIAADAFDIKGGLREKAPLLDLFSKTGSYFTCFDR